MSKFDELAEKIKSLREQEDQIRNDEIKPALKRADALKAERNDLEDEFYKEFQRVTGETGKE